MNYNDNAVIITAVLVSNLVALLMLWLSWKRPVTARLFFFLLFIWAGITNISTAVNKPEVYLEYADFAILPFYKNFILGFFSRHITIFVAAIGISQLLIGIAITLRGFIFKAGCTGGIIFLLSILPLGFGSGSPAPLWWAIGLYLLFREKDNLFLWAALKRKKKENTASNTN